MNRIFGLIVLIGVPLTVIGSVFGWPSMAMFILCLVTVIAISSFMGRATESLAIVSGPRVGGLLNATFGNAIELIISIFALKAGLIGVVLASLTGSILGNLLLVGGLSFFLGGIKFKRQKFNVHDATHNSGLLIFAVIVAFVIPEIFSMTMNERATIQLSVSISVILILLYLAGLFFKLVTHRGVYAHAEPDVERVHEEPEWSKPKAILILLVATVIGAYVSENLVHTFEEVGEQLGWSELFIGVIIVAIVGNAAEHASALIMAMKNKMDVAVEIAIGSTLQVAMSLPRFLY